MRVVSAVVGGVLLIAIVTTVVCNRRIQHVTLPESAVVALPGSYGEFEFTRIGIHPYVAEYSAWITLRNGTSHPLPINTGWGTYVNVYLIREGQGAFLRLHDQGGEYLLDLKHDRLYLIVCRSGRCFAGEFKDEHPAVAGGGPPDDPAAFRMSIDGAPARPLEELVRDRRGEYLGVITGGTRNLRFVPQSELPEKSPKE